jgi:hypothetical protein
MDEDCNAPASKGDRKDEGARCSQRSELPCADIGRGFDDLKASIEGRTSEIIEAFNLAAERNVLRTRLAKIECRLAELAGRLNSPPTK